MATEFVSGTRLVFFSVNIKGELNPKIDFSSFEHLGIAEQLCEVFFKLLVEQFKKI